MTRSVVFSEAEARRAGLKEPDPFGDLPPKKKKAGTGSTAMKHARATVEVLYGPQPVLEAQKKVVWMPTKTCDSCGRGMTPRSTKEDLFGCFDLMVLASPVALIQVTTEQKRGSSVWQRKKKIEENFVAEYGDELNTRYGRPPDLLIWSWVARKHFRTWRWDWMDAEWREDLKLPSPLLKR